MGEQKNEELYELLKTLSSSSSSQNEGVILQQSAYRGDSGEIEKLETLIRRISNNMELNFDDCLKLFEILKKCSSCPMLNYHQNLQSYPLCEDCILSLLGLIVRTDINGGSAHNIVLGSLLYSLSKASLLIIKHSDELASRLNTFDKEKKEFELKRNKRKANFYKRKELYEEKWVKADPKPTKKALAKEIGISVEQLYRDFRDLGY